MYDVLIIGAGICGSFLAYDLSHYEGKIAVLEKGHDVAGGVTMANSAIIHAGYDPEDGTLKAKLNVAGAKRYPEVAKEIGAAYQKIGGLVIATQLAQLPHLKTLYQRGQARGVKCELFTKEAVHALEAHLQDDVCGALSVPDTAIISPWEMVIDLMETAMLNGTELYLEECVQAVNWNGDHYEVHTNHRVWKTKRIINAAGLGAEAIATMIDGVAPFQIQKKRGQYYVLSKLAKSFVHQVLYPLPSEKGKGVLCVPTIHGNILLGPDAQFLEKEDLGTTQAGLQSIQEQLRYLVQDIPYHEVIRAYSGIRPCGNGNDFYIKESASHPGVIHLGCIDSPGLASAPAISTYVIDLLYPHHDLIPKQNYRKRESQVCMKQLSKAERKEWIQRDPRYGRIICRCEEISEGEILDAIHRPCGARSIKEVKKRVRPGMGKCQGGFCEVEVAKLLARELHIPLCEVLYDGSGSELGKEVK